MVPKAACNKRLQKRRGMKIKLEIGASDFFCAATWIAPSSSSDARVQSS